jgi:N-acetyl-gamma-glutamyl-phosphate reductase
VPRVAVLGASGYAGAVAAMLVHRHPCFELAHVTARSEAGARLDDIHPRTRVPMELEPWDARVQSDVDAALVCWPHRVAAPAVAELRERGVRVVDLSADFRLRDRGIYEDWYGAHGAPALFGQGVYGLPELHRDAVRGAGLVANPGCYPTATQLGFLPLVEAGVVDLDHLVADAKSGVSGAGRKAELHLSFSEAADNFVAYNLPGHRHWPEIRQGLAQAARREVGLVFAAHLTPLIRGIHATLYARITQEIDFQKLFEKRYAREPFVDVMPAGSHPDTRSVRAANLCRIAVHRPPEGRGRADTLVVLSVIDNLVKGASGQAVQNMNLMFGLAEASGLSQLAVVP